MKTTLTLAAAALVSATTYAETVHVQQGPDYVFGSSASDSGDANLYLSTDDFTLASTAVVRTVTFTGEYKTLASVPATTDAFTFFVFADEGGLPAETPMYQTSDAVVARTPLGDGSYAAYKAELPNLLTLDAGTYWIGIQNHHGLPGRWAWARYAVEGMYAYRSSLEPDWVMSDYGDLVFSLAGPKGQVHFYDFERNGDDHDSGFDTLVGDEAEFLAAEENASFAMGRALAVPPIASSANAAGMSSRNTVAFGLGDFTVAFAYRNDAFDSDPGDSDALIDAIDSTTGWGVYSDDAGMTLRMRTDEGGLMERNWSTGMPAATAWTHYAFVCDRSAMGGGQWYVNGVATGPVFDAASLGAISPAEGFRIGYDDATGEGADGAIDRVRIYTTALTEADVRALAAEVTPQNVAACSADLDGDGVVASGDLAALLAGWGSCP